MEKKYIAAVDQGRTSTRFIIFGHAGSIFGWHQLEHQQIYPQAGWVKHNPVQIRENTREVIRVTFNKANISAKEIAAIGITNQRETTVI